MIRSMGMDDTDPENFLFYAAFHSIVSSRNAQALKFNSKIV